jgi:hypothetical protein
MIPEQMPMPEMTIVNDCQSKACKDRLQHVLGEMLKAHQGVRTLIIAMEEEQISASQHILHLQLLKRYMDEMKLMSLTEKDIKQIFNESTGIENPDVEMGFDHPTARPSTNHPSAGPSANLSSQSLSINGFSDDDDSDYIPER